MEKINEILKRIKEKGKIYCLGCDVEVDFSPTRKTANCPQCNKLIHRTSVESQDARFHCLYCNDFLIIPYVEQIDDAYKVMHVVCDSCADGRKFEDLSRKEGMKYITFQAKFRKDNDIPFYKRWEKINLLTENAKKENIKELI